MDYEEIVFFEHLGFGWVVDRGVMAKVFPQTAGKKKATSDPAGIELERRKRAWR